MPLSGAGSKPTTLAPPTGPRAGGNRSRSFHKPSTQVLQIYLSFSSTPSIPRLIRGSLELPVGQVVERALTIYEEEIAARNLHDTDAVPSVIPSDYMVRIAQPDGTPDRSLPHLSLEKSLAAQHVSFPYMMVLSLDVQKDAASLHLLPAYAALVAARAATPAPGQDHEAVRVANAHLSAVSGRRAVGGSGLSELERLREERLASKERAQAAHEGARLAAAETAVKQRIAARAAGDSRGASLVRSDAAATAAERRAEAARSYRSDYATATASTDVSVGARLLAADEGVAMRMAELAERREKAAAAAAAREHAIMSQRPSGRVGAGAVASLERTAEMMDEVSMRVAVECAANEARRDLLRQQEERLDVLLQQQVHDAAVLDAHRRERYELKCAARKRERAAVPLFVAHSESFGGTL